MKVEGQGQGRTSSRTINHNHVDSGEGILLSHQAANAHDNSNSNSSNGATGEAIMSTQIYRASEPSSAYSFLPPTMVPDLRHQTYHFTRPVFVSKLLLFCVISWSFHTGLNAENETQP